MSFAQGKLTKTEWDSIEVPLTADECQILRLITKGYQDVHYKENPALVLAQVIKLKLSADTDRFLFARYLLKPALALQKKYALPWGLTPNMETISTPLKKADLIRVQNTDQQIQNRKAEIFEFVLLDQLSLLLQARTKGTYKSKSQTHDVTWTFYLYGLTMLLSYNIPVNSVLRELLAPLLSQWTQEVPLSELVFTAQALIERNELLLRYADRQLYDHQKRLFTLSRRPNPKLIFYMAPTGTGKTMSPIGLAEQHRVVFVCAARHVGLALAKAAISIDKKVAFAFGCRDAADIRLHYFAAKDYTKNKKSGGIWKVDNSQGEKVEIMICDIQSYLYAMHYMIAFNPVEQLILYWDEPTIALDYADHPLHATIQQTWSGNLIPNIVLSSATLPARQHVSDMVADFNIKFANGDVFDIISHDCKKSIPLLTREGVVAMPHFASTEYADVKGIATHVLTEHPTLQRYLDLGEVCAFIKAAQPCVEQTPFSLDQFFTTITDITMASVKQYYLTLLRGIPSQKWPALRDALVSARVQPFKSTVNIVSTDAFTLTDGPTIFLADDVVKIARFYLQSANIPELVLKHLMTLIERNSHIAQQLSLKQKDLEDAMGQSSDNKSGSDDNKGGSGASKRDKEKPVTMTTAIKELMLEIEHMQAQIQTTLLDSIYVPNTHDHLRRYAPHWTETQSGGRPFTSDIPEHIVEAIMRLDDVESIWKLLLLMGIGVFGGQTNIAYTEIMKDLAQNQKLFMIIADTDYIYGTNYQFCHGYVGKDLLAMSQEKCIQAMGRVGRQNLQQHYSVRFRDNSVIDKLFSATAEKPEVDNFNRLFVTLAQPE